jgi:hypothetical protein
LFDEPGHAPGFYFFRAQENLRGLRPDVSDRTFRKSVAKAVSEKLGIRNSSAHPSAIVIKKSKVIEFVDDLVENVILKYKV